LLPPVDGAASNPKGPADLSRPMSLAISFLKIRKKMRNKTTITIAIAAGHTMISITTIPALD
jgi:hypothetical protein